MLSFVLNAIQLMFGFYFSCILLLGFGIVFFIIVFIYDYCIIYENLPYIGTCKLLSAIVVFYY